MFIYLLYLVLGVFLALVDELLGHHLVLGVGIFVDKSVALILGILETLKLFLLYTLLCQLKLAFHHKQSKPLAQLRVREILQGILCCNDASLVVVASVCTVAEILAEVVI